MLKVRDFLAQLDEGEHLTLIDAIGAGLHDASMAALCLTDPGPQAEHVAQLLAYLTRAIGSLEAARDVVRRHA